jgi:uncharacterized protein YbjT (DUF2867 family)
MNVLVTGTTGMVGKGVLLECLDHPDVDKVISISRSGLGMEQEKLLDIIHEDFSDYTSIKDKLEGLDACFLCMGVSAAGLSEEKYTKITYDYTLELASTLLELNPNIVCAYVSGQGTDSSEKGRSMWARVKGKTENDLLNMGFRHAYMFRPGAIIPLRGIKSSTKLYQFVYDYFMWLIKLIRFFSPNSVVNTTEIGLSMINLVKSPTPDNIINPAEIKRLASK